MVERYFLAQSESCDWYVVPVSKVVEWRAWLELPESDERSWSEPEFAIAVNGAPGRVTFVDPKVD